MSTCVKCSKYLVLCTCEQETEIFNALKHIPCYPFAHLFLATDITGCRRRVLYSCILYFSIHVNYSLSLMIDDPLKVLFLRIISIDRNLWLIKILKCINIKTHLHMTWPFTKKETEIGFINFLLWKSSG